jgi:hypothetical protein
VSEQSDLERDLRLLESSLRKLETEYTMFFAGTLPRPPVEDRARVEKLLRRYDRAYIQSYADRFRLNTIQARFIRFADLWDRGLRAREEGRPGPFGRSYRDGPPAPPPPAVSSPEPEAPVAPQAAAPRAPQAPADRVVTLSDPADRTKVLALYESLIEARRATGNQDPFPFQRFAQMIKTQVTKIQEGGSGDVSFKVSVKDNKVSFVARGGQKEGEE